MSINEPALSAEEAKIEEGLAAAEAATVKPAATSAIEAALQLARAVGIGATGVKLTDAQIRTRITKILDMAPRNQALGLSTQLAKLAKSGAEGAGILEYLSVVSRKPHGHTERNMAERFLYDLYKIKDTAPEKVLDTTEPVVETPEVAETATPATLAETTPATDVQPETDSVRASVVDTAVDTSKGTTSMDVLAAAIQEAYPDKAPETARGMYALALEMLEEERGTESRANIESAITTLAQDATRDGRNASKASLVDIIKTVDKFSGHTAALTPEDQAVLHQAVEIGYLQNYATTEPSAADEVRNLLDRLNGVEPPAVIHAKALIQEGETRLTAATPPTVLTAERRAHIDSVVAQLVVQHTKPVQRTSGLIQSTVDPLELERHLASVADFDRAKPEPSVAAPVPLVAQAAEVDEGTQDVGVVHAADTAPIAQAEEYERIVPEDTPAAGGLDAVIAGVYDAATLEDARAAFGKDMLRFNDVYGPGAAERVTAIIEEESHNPAQVDTIREFLRKSNLAFAQVKPARATGVYPADKVRQALRQQIGAEWEAQLNQMLSAATPTTQETVDQPDADDTFRALVTEVYGNGDPIAAQNKLADTFGKVEAVNGASDTDHLFYNLVADANTPGKADEVRKFLRDLDAATSGIQTQPLANYTDEEKEAIFAALEPLSEEITQRIQAHRASFAANPVADNANQEPTQEAAEPPARGRAGRAIHMVVDPVMAAVKHVLGRGKEEAAAKRAAAASVDLDSEQMKAIIDGAYEGDDLAAKKATFVRDMNRLAEQTGKDPLPFVVGLQDAAKKPEGAARATDTLIKTLAALDVQPDPQTGKISPEDAALALKAAKERKTYEQKGKKLIKQAGFGKLRHGISAVAGGVKSFGANFIDNIGVTAIGAGLGWGARGLAAGGALMLGSSALAITAAAAGAIGAGVLVAGFTANIKYEREQLKKLGETGIFRTTGKALLNTFKTMVKNTRELLPNNITERGQKIRTSMLFAAGGAAVGFALREAYEAGLLDGAVDKVKSFFGYGTPAMAPAAFMQGGAGMPPLTGEGMGLEAPESAFQPTPTTQAPGFTTPDIPWTPDPSKPLTAAELGRPVRVVYGPGAPAEQAPLPIPPRAEVPPPAGTEGHTLPKDDPRGGQTGHRSGAGKDHTAHDTHAAKPKAKLNRELISREVYGKGVGTSPLAVINAEAEIDSRLHHASGAEHAPAKAKIVGDDQALTAKFRREVYAEASARGANSSAADINLAEAKIKDLVEAAKNGAPARRR